MNKAKVVFIDCNKNSEHIVMGRIAETIWNLNKVGSKGITALEVSSWALRLGAYIHVLRHEHDLDITTIREPHQGGNHARYVLVSEVEIKSAANIN